jgi:hypothetical protein
MQLFFAIFSKYSKWFLLSLIVSTVSLLVYKAQTAHSLVTFNSRYIYEYV